MAECEYYKLGLPCIEAIANRGVPPEMSKFISILAIDFRIDVATVPLRL